MPYSDVLAYIQAYWPRITRHQTSDVQTLIGLPYPYMVTSADGEMLNEMYYWDSYFTALGLVGTPHAQVAVDMTNNLLYLLQRFGLIPNANRYYFLSRSQPPVLTSMIWLKYDIKRARGDKDAAQQLQTDMAAAEREHHTVWLGTAQPHKRLVHAGLSRYYDINVLDMLASCESGWDHSTRCQDRWLEHLPVDLNSILYIREKDFERAALLAGEEARAEQWYQRAKKRQQTISDLMWDGDQGFFFDYDYVNQRRTPHPSLAGFYPLWAGLASAAQAARVVRDWLPRFELAGGLVSSLDAQPGRQWAYPNGWAPLQWIVVAGLEHYGYQAEARRIRQKWCNNCAAVFAKTGAMWEKYNVAEIGGREEGGLYGSVRGFGWSNGVFADFARHL